MSTQNPTPNKTLLFVDAYNRLYWETQGKVTLAKIAEELDLSQERVALETSRPEFEKMLKERGLPGFKPEREILSGKQLVAVDSVLNLHDKRSLNSKLKEAGVTTREWQAWLAEPEFVKYLRKQTKERFKNVDIDADLALAQLVSNGDLSAIKYYHEFTGIYRPGTEVGANLTVIMSRILEILAKHVTKEVLLAVAAELEGEKVLEVAEVTPKAELVLRQEEFFNGTEPN